MMLIINGATRSNLRFVNVHVSKFPLIFLTNYDCVNQHTNDIPSVDRKLKGWGDIRLESEDVQRWNLSAARRKIISGIAGPAEVSGIRTISYSAFVRNTRITNQRALRFQGTTTIFQGERHDVTPSSWNVLTPRYEIEITKASPIPRVWYFSFCFSDAGFAFSREQPG